MPKITPAWYGARQSVCPDSPPIKIIFSLRTPENESATHSGLTMKITARARKDVRGTGRGMDDLTQHRITGEHSWGW